MSSKLPCFLTGLIILLFSSCASSKKIVYFQDAQPGDTFLIGSLPEIRIKPDDQLSIIVNSKDPQLANLFNLPIYTSRVGASLSGTQYISNYTVDREGNIEFPILGTIRVAGMTRREIADTIIRKMKEGKYLNDPVVTVEFMNFGVSVLGEVAKPGRYEMTNDRFSILDAISSAGDLTIHGQRCNVYVLRTENGVNSTYQVNLLSAEDMYASPAYYLQQNDVVYVEPNAMRARQSTVNGNNVLSASFWISLTSLLTTIAVLFIK